MENQQIQFISISPEELETRITERLKKELFEKVPAKNPLRYYTREEVAKLLKITLPTLNFYTKRGIIKGSRLGTRVLYDEESVKQAVKEIPAQKYKRS